MPRSQRRKETIVLRHWKKVTGWTLLTAFFAVGTLLAQDPVRHLQYMVGERATILDQVERQGYSYVRGTKEGGSSYTYYEDQRSDQCIVARTFDGRVASIVYAPEFDCNNQQGGDSGWGSGSSSYGATLYRDLNFSGTSQSFSDDVSDLRGSYVGNDTVTSVRVSRGCRARLYADASYRGAYLEVDRDISDLRGTRVGNDSVTSVQVSCNGGGGGWGGGSGSAGGSSSYGVTLYRDLNFSGTSQTFTEDSSDLRSSYVGNDNATSVRVSRGCRARLYADANYRGAYLEVDRDISDLRGTRVGNDTVSSVQVRCDGSSSGGGWGGGNPSYGVTLYRDLNFQGRGESFSEDVADLRSSYVGSDTTTSVRVGQGCRARLYADANYRGAYLEVDRDILDLRGTRVGNDTVSSVQVRCEGGGGGWGGGSESGWGGGSSSYGVTLYRDLNFSGASQTFSDDVSDLRGSYVGNDNATSARVSRGCRARLYADANYRGAYLEVDRDVSDLRNTRVGNDTVTSVQVRCDR